MTDRGCHGGRWPPRRVTASPVAARYPACMRCIGLPWKCGRLQATQPSASLHRSASKERCLSMHAPVVQFQSHKRVGLGTDIWLPHPVRLVAHLQRPRARQQRIRAVIFCCHCPDSILHLLLQSMCKAVRSRLARYLATKRGDCGCPQVRLVWWKERICRARRKQALHIERLPRQVPRLHAKSQTLGAHPLKDDNGIAKRPDPGRECGSVHHWTEWLKRRPYARSRCLVADVAKPQARRWHMRGISLFDLVPVQLQSNKIRCSAPLQHETLM